MPKLVQALIVGVVALVALGGGVALYLQSMPEDPPARETVLALTRVEMKDLAGTPQKLERWQGKVVVVNFWASWCPPCLEEIPGLVNAQQKLGDNGLQVIGIAVESAEKAQGAARQLGINYPVLVGGAEVIDFTRKLGNRAGALPYTVVLDRAGNMVAAHLGILTEAQLGALVAPLLAGKA